jgi:hypothetical protein
MKINMKKAMIIFSIIIVLALSAITASARDNSISKDDIFAEDGEIKTYLIIAQNPNIEIVRENGKGGEDRIQPFDDIKKDLEDIESVYKDPLVILGKEVSKDGSNDLLKILKLPVFIICAIIGLLVIIMVCNIRKK